MLDGPTTLTKATFSIFCLQLTTSTAELLLPRDPPRLSPCNPRLNVLPTATPLLPSPSFVVCSWKVLSLAGAALKGLSEEEELDLCAIVSGFYNRLSQNIEMHLRS